MFHLLNGVIIGLAVSAPLGPIGMICLNYAFSHGFRLAILAGLGAAIADTTYACIAGYGLGFVSEWLLDHYFTFSLVGGAFLVGLGFHIATAPPVKRMVQITHGSEASALFSTMFFTFSNPLTLIVFATLFGCMATTEGTRTAADTTFLVTGIFVGAMFWWTSLSLLGTYLRSKISVGLLNRVRKLVGLGIMGFGACFFVYTWWI